MGGTTLTSIDGTTIIRRRACLIIQHHSSSMLKTKITILYVNIETTFLGWWGRIFGADNKWR